MVALAVVDFGIGVGESELPGIEVAVNGVLLVLKASGGGLELFLALELPVFVETVEKVENGVVAVGEDGAVADVMVADGGFNRSIGAPDDIIVDFVVAVAGNVEGALRTELQLLSGIIGDVIEEITEGATRRGGTEVVVEVGIGVGLPGDEIDVVAVALG